MKKCALGMIIYLFGTASGAWSDTYTHSILDIESFVFEGVDFEIACGVENQVVVKAKSEDDFELISDEKKLKVKSISNRNWFSGRGLPTVFVKATVQNAPTRIKARTSEGTVSECSWNQGSLEIHATAGSEIRISSFRGNLSRVQIDASSNGDVELNGEMSIVELEVDVSSAASVELGGAVSASELDLKASSGSDFQSDENQKIHRAKVNLSSGATAEICGAQGVSGNLSSGGLLEVGRSAYPNSMNIDKSSGGRVEFDCN